MSVQRKPLSEKYVVELTDDMSWNHVANSEEEARKRTASRFNTDKDVTWNTVVKGTPASVAKAVGESEEEDGQPGEGDRFYQPIDAAYWQYYAGLKGSSGTKVDEADEEHGSVWLKCFEKPLKNKTIVKVTGIDSTD